MFKLVQTCRNLLKLAQTCSTLVNLAQSCSKFFKPDKFWINLWFFFSFLTPASPMSPHYLWLFSIFNPPPSKIPGHWWRYLWTTPKPFRRVKSSLFSRRSHQFYFSTTSLSLRAKNTKKINKKLILQLYIFLFFKQSYCQNNTFSHEVNVSKPF